MQVWCVWVWWACSMSAGSGWGCAHAGLVCLGVVGLFYVFWVWVGSAYLGLMCLGVVGRFHVCWVWEGCAYAGLVHLGGVHVPFLVGVFGCASAGFMCLVVVCLSHV